MDCPTCEDTGFTEHGLKSHHSQVHDESLVSEYACAYCGDAVSVPPSGEDYDKHFCDNSCQSKWRSDNMRIEGFNTEHRVYTCCGWCDKELSVKRYRAEEQENHFCDQNCMGEFYAENADRKPPSERFSGHDSRLWSERRQSVLMRDSFECQDCGMGEEKHLVEYGSSLDVHHIKPAKQFESEEKAHTLDNLIALCKRCHAVREQKS